MVAYEILKTFFSQGLSSGSRFRTPASGYEIRKEKINLTVGAGQYSSFLGVCPWTYARRSRLQADSRHSQTLVRHQ